MDSYMAPEITRTLKSQKRRHLSTFNGNNQTIFNKGGGLLDRLSLCERSSFHLMDSEYGSRHHHKSIDYEDVLNIPNDYNNQ